MTGGFRFLFLEKKRKVFIEHESTIATSSNNKNKLKQHSSASASCSSTDTTTTTIPTFSKPAPSKLLSKLASITEANKRARAEAELDGDGDGKQQVERSVSFDDKVTTCKKKKKEEKTIEEDNASNETGTLPKRDSRLALVEELEMGPYEFTPMGDDPEFEKLEPHSGIRLVCVLSPPFFWVP